MPSQDRFVFESLGHRLIFLPTSAALPTQMSCRSQSEIAGELMSLRDSPSAHFELQSLYDTVCHGAGDAAFPEMAKQVAQAASSGDVRAYLVPASAAGGAPVMLAASGQQGDETPVAFKDDDGKAVLNDQGAQMMRPAGMDPHFFIAQGQRDKEIENDMLTTEGGGPAVLGYQTGELAKFKQGGPWDAQRINGSFHPEFVDYATVVIGLYAVASGMSDDDILKVENLYAALFSHFAKATVMDRTYTHLPARNVFNTRLGVTLFTTRRIRAAANTPAKL